MHNIFFTYKLLLNENPEYSTPSSLNGLVVLHCHIQHVLLEAILPNEFWDCGAKNLKGLELNTAERPAFTDVRERKPKTGSRRESGIDVGRLFV